MRTRQRVWYIYPPVGGPGLGRYWRAYRLCKLWRAAGIDCLVIGPGYHHYFLDPAPRAGFKDIDGAPHYFVKTRPYTQKTWDRARAMLLFGLCLLGDKALKEAARTAPPDVVIYSSPYPFAIPAAWALARRVKARFVLEVRDLWPLSLIQIQGVSRWHPFTLLAAFCEWFGYTHAHRVVSVLPNASRHMVTKGLTADKFVYIPNLVESCEISEAARCHALPTHIRALRDDGRFVILHAGNIAKTTPLRSLLEALASLTVEEQVGLRLVLVGRGDEAEAIQSLVSELKLTCVEFHPQVERSVALAAMAQAHVGYASCQNLPLYRFGLSPNKVYDYMSQGLPVIFAYTADDNPIAATGGAIGCAVDDTETITAAVRSLMQMSDAERAVIGGAGKLYVATYHAPEKLARAYASAIELVAPEDLIHDPLTTRMPS